jgi:hypothetical protein
MGKVSCEFCKGELLRRPSRSGRYYCGTQCKAQWQRLARPATPDWLREQYVDLGLDCVQIAAIVKRNPKRVWEWLQDIGIETRPRGGITASGSFAKGCPALFKGRKHTPENREHFRRIRLIDGHVPYLKDGVHWLKATGRRPGTWKGGITPQRQVFYATEEWKACVAAVWERDQSCRRCDIPSHSTPGGRLRFDLHHIDSFMIVARRADPANVILVCVHCHRWIQSRHNQERRFLGEGQQLGNASRRLR